MTSRVPVGPPDFDPVRLRYRRDGWTPERQIAFVRALALHRKVGDACRKVGLSLQSAYQLYRRPDAASFRRAWDAALTQAGPTPSPPSAAEAPAPPRRPSRAIRPAAAIAARSGIVPAEAASASASWQPSTSSTFSTSAPAAAEADGGRRDRRVHQLPPGDRLQAVKTAGVDSSPTLCFRRGP